METVGGRRETWTLMLMSAARQHAAVLLVLTFLLSVSALEVAIHVHSKTETNNTAVYRENTIMGGTV